MYYNSIYCGERFSNNILKTQQNQHRMEAFFFLYIKKKFTLLVLLIINTIETGNSKYVERDFNEWFRYFFNDLKIIKNRNRLVFRFN